MKRGVAISFFVQIFPIANKQLPILNSPIMPRMKKSPEMKFFLMLLAVVIWTASCDDPVEQKVVQQAPPSNEHVELVNQYFEHFNNHDWEKMAAMYLDPADFKDPSLGAGVVKQTREETIGKYVELNAIFPDLHDELIQIYPSGEKHVIVEFVSTGTAPDGSTFELPICTIFTFEDGKIAKDYTYYDNFDEGGGE